MKKIYIVPAIAILFLTATAFQKKKKTPSLNNAKAISANLAKIKDNLYAWKTEISNAEYGLFIRAMQLEDPQHPEKYAIDSAGWRSETTYNEPHVTYYHKHPAYQNYPVVNVNYGNAQAFCNWLTSVYHKDEKRKFKKCVFVLPSKEEWQFAASGGDLSRTYPWGTGFVKNRKGNYLSNFKIENRNTGLISGNTTFSTASVESFFPNNFGLYNCSGNVAEMLDQKNTATGGSWNSPVHLTQINSIQTYDGSSPEIGFRVFMKVLDK